MLQFQDCEQKGPRFNGEDERARMCVLPAFVRTIVSVPCLLFGQRMLLASRASVTKAEESVTVVEDFALYSQTLETSSYAIRRRNIFLLLKTIQFRYERMTREKLNFKVRFKLHDGENTLKGEERKNLKWVVCKIYRDILEENTYSLSSYIKLHS